MTDYKQAYTTVCNAYRTVLEAEEKDSQTYLRARLGYRALVQEYPSWLVKDAERIVKRYGSKKKGRKE